MTEVTSAGCRNASVGTFRAQCMLEKRYQQKKDVLLEAILSSCKETFFLMIQLKSPHLIQFYSSHSVLARVWGQRWMNTHSQAHCNRGRIWKWGEGNRVGRQLQSKHQTSKGKVQDLPDNIPHISCQLDLVMNSEKAYSCSTLVYLGLRRRDLLVFPALCG